MKSYLLFIFGVFMMGPGVALAGHEVGNGGNGVVCRNGSGAITTVQLLDYFQYEDKLPYDLGPKSWTYLQKVDFALTRLEKLDSTRATYFQKEANQFTSVTHWQDGPLQSIPDSGFVPVPANCSIQQMAVQHVNNDSQGKRYAVTNDLWNWLDDDGKAGLILHEVIYREEIRLGYTDSIKARYYNAVISSDQINTMTSDAYDDFAKMIFQPVQHAGFAQDKYTINVKVSTTTSLDLHSLLAFPGVDALTWYLIPDPPSWVNLAEDSGILTITPSAANVGSYSLTMVVREDSNGSLAGLTLVVEP